MIDSNVFIEEFYNGLIFFLDGDGGDDFEEIGDIDGKRHFGTRKQFKTEDGVGSFQNRAKLKGIRKDAFGGSEVRREIY